MWNNHPDVVRLLMEHGADPNRVVYGKTALDCALRNNPASEAVAYLRDELGALRGKAVRRRRMLPKAVGVLLRRRLVHARNVWLKKRLKAAKERVAFRPGGVGAQQAAASWKAAVAKEAAPTPTHEPPPPSDEPPAKRARTQ